LAMEKVAKAGGCGETRRSLRPRAIEVEGENP
jgi:hypothetical protein